MLEANNSVIVCIYVCVCVHVHVWCVHLFWSVIVGLSTNISVSVLQQYVLICVF